VLLPPKEQKRRVKPQCGTPLRGVIIHSCGNFTAIQQATFLRRGAACHTVLARMCLHGCEILRRCIDLKFHQEPPFSRQTARRRRKILPGCECVASPAGDGTRAPGASGRIHSPCLDIVHQLKEPGEFAISGCRRLSRIGNEQLDAGCPGCAQSNQALAR